MRTARSTFAARVAGRSAWCGLALFAACAGAPATPEQTRIAERQLLLPYLQQRVVACNELTVELSGNFYANVSNPAADPQRHRFERTESDGVVEKVWTNLTGDRSGWLTVKIGERGSAEEPGVPTGPHTEFKVFNRVCLRTRSSGAMALDATTKGPVIVVQEAGAEAQPVVEFRVVEGALQRR